MGFWQRIAKSFRRRPPFAEPMRPNRKRPRPGGHLMPEPVEPDPRKPRSGGAEAALEFDD